MDKVITVRLYRIERRDPTVPRFIEVLRGIDSIDGYANRERQLTRGMHVRLELLREENTHVVSGELTRIQNTNLPSEVTAEGRISLSIRNRLGHSVVFRANHHSGLLAVEYNTRICSPGRLIGYMQQFNPAAQYNMRSIVRQDAWERFNRSGARKLMISVASPTDLAVLDGSGQAVGRSFASMGEAYGAPKITIEISMGRAHGTLYNSARELIQNILQKKDEHNLQIEKLAGVVENEPEPIDFLGEILVFREELELHDRDPDVNFEIKRNFLERAMHGLG